MTTSVSRFYIADDKKDTTITVSTKDGKSFVFTSSVDNKFEHTFSSKEELIKAVQHSHEYVHSVGADIEGIVNELLVKYLTAVNTKLKKSLIRALKNRIAYKESNPKKYNSYVRIVKMLQNGIKKSYGKLQVLLNSKPTCKVVSKNYRRTYPAPVGAGEMKRAGHTEGDFI